MIAAKTFGIHKIEKVQKVSSIKPFCAGTNDSQKQSNFQSILTTMVYEKKETKEDDRERSILEGTTYFESYNNSAHCFYPYQKHTTDIRC